MTVKCPYCKKSYSESPKLAGRRVRCSDCNETFTYPAAARTVGEEVSQHAPPVKTEAFSDSSTGAFPDIEFAGLKGNNSRYYRPHSTSIWDIFDWRFKKYLTPLIVKITWIAILAATFLFLMFVIVNQAISLITLEPSPGAKGNAAQAPFQRPPFAPRVPSELESSDSRLDMKVAYRVASVIGTVISLFFFLLWIRVLLECIIVAFNISNTLNEIERETKPPCL